MSAKLPDKVRRRRLQEMGRLMQVPCGGCTLCCQSDLVRLLPEDDPDEYQNEPHPTRKGELMLAHRHDPAKPDELGPCVYLGEGGCTIHERRPMMCREMDCRTLAMKMTFAQALMLDAVPVWRRGRELMEKFK